MILNIRDFKESKKMLTFNPITKSYRKQLEKDLYEAIISQFREEEVEKDCYSYNIYLNRSFYKKKIWDDEIKDAIICAIDIMEAMKKRNNAGLDKKRFKDMMTKYENTIERTEEVNVIEKVIADGI